MAMPAGICAVSNGVLAMEIRTLGRTGLQVTVLGYGAMALRGSSAGYGTDSASTGDAEAILPKLLDAGVNFIDTAPDYGYSEQRIGKVVGHRRNEFYLATKCGCNIPRDDNADEPPHIWTRQRLLANIELSLSRLNTDYVDIWQLHNPTPEQVQDEDLVRVMEQVKQQGKVRHVSISSTLPHIHAFIEKGAFDTYQIPYSSLQPIEEDSITAAAKSGAGTIIRGGVAKGEPQDMEDNVRWGIWEKANLDELRAEGESRSAFLLRCTISHPYLHTTIVGTRDPNHLQENLDAAEKGPLDPGIYEQVKKRLQAVKP